MEILFFEFGRRCRLRQKRRRAESRSALCAAAGDNRKPPPGSGGGFHHFPPGSAAGGLPGVPSACGACAAGAGCAGPGTNLRSHPARFAIGCQEWMSFMRYRPFPKRCVPKTGRREMFARRFLARVHRLCYTQDASFPPSYRDLPVKRGESAADRMERSGNFRMDALERMAAARPGRAAAAGGRNSK